MNNYMRKGNTLFILIFLVSILAIGYISILSSTKNSSLGALKLPERSPVATPFPFEDLTIPHLRNRDYDSKLEDLKQINSNQNYTSYLTNYDSDGFKINGLLTVPNSGTNHPAVVFVHGYIPPQQYQTTSNYSSYVDYLARNGIVVFKIDLRGHDRSEGEASGAYYSGDYIVDVLNAYSALKNAEFVDRDNIGLWGHSMAGNVVFRSMAAMPEIPKVVIWAGAVYTYEDFSEYRISDNSYQPPPEQSERRRRRQELFDTYGEFDPSSEFWQKVPATNYLDGVNGEVQVHHAIDDNVVNIGYSRNLMDILDNTDIPHELYEYQSGGHNITGVSFNQAMSRTVDFFKK